MSEGWTPERVTTLKMRWLQGLSASQIAKELGGATRNAVISKVHRLGLAGRAAPSRPAKRIVRPRPPKVIALAKLRSAPVIVRDERPSSRKPPAPSATSIRFLDLKPGQCKMFCDGEEGPEGLCCGRPAHGSWCKCCAALVYVPVRQGKAA